MKVLLWAEAYLPAIGGVEVFAHHLATALTDRGHEIHLVASRTDATSADREQLARHLRISRFPFRTVLQSRDPRGVLALQNQILELKRSFAPDLVHLNSTLPSAYFHRRTADQAPAPVVLTLHVPGLQKIGAEGLLGQLLHSADRVVAVSTALFDEVAAMTPDVRQRMRVIHNAVPTPVRRPPPLPCDPPTAVCLGRLSRQKGFDVALQSFSLIRRRHPTARLIVAGDGEELGHLRRLRAEVGLDESVELTGWVQPENVPELLARSTVVLMPSRYEPFGLVALEAAHMARPVVASWAGGLPEVVADGITGLLVPPEDPTALAGAVCSLFADPILAARLGRNGRRRAREEFRFEDFVDAYESLFLEQSARGRLECEL